ncbi:hypothetical protein Pcinc_024525 [Petrolisthes cinctipes]|uniref:Uncharacterized protein n=1 Tax=Petrolisthes cinctipes TaxID=88211 RepID=A0AAE1F9R0_PETCI|nr:hypothetical protein Pcinc_024525 [Petrolisthes cinctipes]
MGGGEMSDVEMGGGDGNVMLYVLQVVLVPDEYVAATGQEVVYRAEASGTQLRYDWLLPGNLLLIDQDDRSLGMGDRTYVDTNIHSEVFGTRRPTGHVRRAYICL